MSLSDALNLYLRRRDRLDHPAGSFDRAGRWWPNDAEQQSCCSAIRSPSRAWPYSLLVHCRSLGHVAALTGVAPSELRRLARRAEPFAVPA